MNFYDRIAGQYEHITGEAHRLPAARALVDELLRRAPGRRILDTACGTGLHAVLLAERGADVTGADPSPAMLAAARRRAGNAGVSVRWLQAPMQRLARRLEGPFDAILCVGNSLPHLLTAAELDAAAAAFAALLAPAGLLAVGLLNYARVLARRERIVGVTREGSVEYVRFYDFLPRRLRFNILRLEWHGRACSHELVQTTLRPWCRDEIESALIRHGLGPTDALDTSLAAFDETTSETLLLLARPNRPSTDPS